MFGKHKRRSSNPIFVLFRLFLSLAIFATLVWGIFSAYKHFTGVDPLKVSPTSLLDNVMSLISQQKLLAILSKSNTSKSPQPEEYKLSNTDFKKEPTKPIKNAKFVFSFALFADSHNDNKDLKKALDQIKKNYSDIKFIIGLGDYTDIGTMDELKAAKEVLDSSGFRYFVTTGDHDLWDSRDKSFFPTHHFENVFGPAYQSFTQDNFKFIILYNSDNYLGLGETQKKWLTDQLSASKDNLGVFVFLHEPLFHPSSDHFMGRVTENLKAEAQALIKQLTEAKVKKVFAGDIHYFSEYEEPQSKLQMVTVGAVTLERNLQNPRFAVVSVFDDGSTKVEDVEIK